MNEKWQKLKEWIDQSSNIVFFGGAGVSTESGIPDFRSVDGLYNQKYTYPPEMIISHSFYVKNPEEFYRFYKDRMIFSEAEPNGAHKALAKLERQIHKHRTKLGKRLREDAFKPGELEYDAASVETVSEDGPAPKVVRHKTFPVRPMSVEDAILQMELLGHSFFVFVNVETDRTNVLYLRKDGDLGLMEPEA